MNVALELLSCDECDIYMILCVTLVIHSNIKISMLVARAGKGLRIFGQIARKSVPTMSIGGNARLFIMHNSRMARAARYHAVRSISDNSTGTKWK